MALLTSTGPTHVKATTKDVPPATHIWTFDCGLQTRLTDVRIVLCGALGKTPKDIHFPTIGHRARLHRIILELTTDELRRTFFRVQAGVAAPCQLVDVYSHQT
jgi:hypothetical protein